MNGFEVDPEVLRAAGARLGEGATTPPAPDSADPASTGDVLLGLALRKLRKASADAVGILFADAGELGERLGKAGDLYTQSQDDAVDRIRRIAEAVERPGAGD
ncbi:hypothetical protein AB0F52_12395 [Amycolatopsis sp. NPDC024027]|uniref:hypothetical protein n=1 Tax=Amycolatopsis sp. NPDC024027 TaxID=3154327 RepID=UPI0033DD73CD